MSVFTPVDRTQLMPWLAAHGIHELFAMSGIAGGAVNTNYWLQTEQGDWVLTLVEDRPLRAVEPIMQLMQTLAEAGLEVPGVRPDKRGQLVSELHDRPATLVQALPGQHPTMHAESAIAVGRFLANLHGLILPLPGLPLNFGPDWQRETVAVWQPRLNIEQRALMQRAWDVSARVWSQPWPAGWIHADLFPDNVLMTGNLLQGVIDWYFASVGPRIWDIAVTLNAWGGSKGVEQGLNRNLLQAYQTIQPLSGAEMSALPAMRISAALRFWLSRLNAADHQHGDSDQVTVKSPADYETLLLDLLQ